MADKYLKVEGRPDGFPSRQNLKTKACITPLKKCGKFFLPTTP